MMRPTPKQRRKEMVRMRKSLLVLSIVAVLVAAFGFEGWRNQAVGEDAEILNFGIVVALSGPAATWGIVNNRSIPMGSDKVNAQGGFKVKGKTYKWNPISYDHKYVPAEAVKAANKAIYDDKVKFIAIQGGAPAVACLSLLKENNMLSLNFAG